MAVKQKKAFSFDRLEIGDVLYQHDPDDETFYFISDRLNGKVFYTTYVFKNKSVIISKCECTLRNFHKSAISNAQKNAIKGDLVKYLMETSSE